MTSSNPGTTRPRQEPSSGTLKKAFINQIKEIKKTYITLSNKYQLSKHENFIPLK